MPALVDVLADLRARSIVAEVDPAATERLRGGLTGMIAALECLAQHGLTLIDGPTPELWSAAFATCEQGTA